MLQNPVVRNKQDALRNQYGVLRWQVKVRDLVLEDGVMPIVDYFRVFIDGRYYGKTKTMSFCLKKSRQLFEALRNRVERQEEENDRDCPACHPLRLLRPSHEVQLHLYCVLIENGSCYLRSNRRTSKAHYGKKPLFVGLETDFPRTATTYTRFFTNRT